MPESLEQLQKEVADHLGIDPLPIKFEFIPDDSRIYYKEEYVGINIKYKNNYEEYAKCITHEYRHVFQVFYCQLIDTETTRRWKGLLANSISSYNMSAAGSDYIGQELEIDALLQSFPDDFIINENDHQAYKQFGNAVNVKVIQYMAEQLFSQKK